ncbi:hypothetical protein [Microbacterium yannicii]|uniref:hypothetical protein n=1 Tax=Microbacterium yannicii TaxID=671622 RepID=UPI0012FAF9A3|nr:hypothetical protein [Microbacterium yannicii]
MVGVRIFGPNVPEGYEWALPVHSGEFEVIATLAERSSRAAWNPIRMKLLTLDDRGRTRQHAHLPWLGSGELVLRDEAIDVIGPLLRRHGEVLPLQCDDARLALFSAPQVAGVLDEQRSEIVRFTSGRIMTIPAAVFRTEVLGHIQAFKLTEMPRGQLYLAEELVESIRATGFSSGTDFTVVYESR